MTVSEKVRKILTSDSRMSVYSTSSKDGITNIAVIGSTTLLEDGTLMIAIGNNRTFTNLQENPCASCLVKIEGTTGLQMEGCRLYLKVKSILDSGEVFDSFISKLRSKIGSAADMLKHVVIFEITEARPIVDMGQGI
ncbi:MAG: pyridoxamine 5'-phosphate oxidase family protein [Bacillota bacterium]